MELLKNTAIDFIGKRKISFLISAIITIIGLIGVVQIARNAANMGIDFSGGTSVQLSFQAPVPLDQARALLGRSGIPEAQLQEIADGNRLLIKVGKARHESGNLAEQITGAFQKEFPQNAFVVESSNEIGPAIGDKLKGDTLKAVGFAMLGIVAYIAWRFDGKFGIGAIVATLHDVLAMVALFFVLDKEVNLLFVTAVLTIAGYSLTDTVVVFDRIRESMQRTHDQPLAEVFNRSINEVLPRTVITSLTTFLAAISLLLFGGEVIHDFALALVTGVVIATYSSIFIAAPIVAELETRMGKRTTQQREVNGIDA
ncbi:protein-export membrane protein SecF [Geomonas silvestris]|uniref:Protein-export membrane protein SecF n=1 Tax=Geomonas silvestris TaxID=2740184 RepID=A0A6V8MDV3_9BACT|nr:protein translocase subunit SecF [Geomonas silvestris]GFO58160.1 protein-export membrane protein SecF [Geomonas silvestris]